MVSKTYTSKRRHTAGNFAKAGGKQFYQKTAGKLRTFLSYLQKRYEEKAFLHFRLVVGPIKNIQQCGANQEPDLAEYLMFIQLARLMDAIAPLYPYRIKIQMIPDDVRGKIANHWPDSYSAQYILGLKKMVRELQFYSWLDVAQGQSHLYKLYEVKKYFTAAEKAITQDPHFQAMFSEARFKAEQNFFSEDKKAISQSAIRDSAMRYLVSHKAEILSGMWSPEDAFPLVYANHPGNYQLYTMGSGITKLPWQLSLPLILSNSTKMWRE